MKKRRRKFTIPTVAGGFCWRLTEMLESPAYRALSRDGHRVLDRLEVENAHHRASENGSLVSTYSDFIKYGVERESVGPSVREVVALGFVVITQEGRGGNAEHRSPTKYRLTYRETEDANPTDDWRSIGDLKEAVAIGREARRAKNPAAVARSQRAAKKQNAGAGLPHVSGRDCRPEKEEAPGRDCRRSSPGRDSRPTIYISSEGTPQTPREARPSGSAEASGAAGDELLASMQGAVAERLGSDGWLILQTLDDAGTLNPFLELEQRGQLSDAALADMRLTFLKARKEAAA